MAGIGKDFHLRTLDSTLKGLGILYRSELVILSTEDERREDDFLYFTHEVESITGYEVSVEHFRPTLQHISDALFDKQRRSLARVSKLIYLLNCLPKIIPDPVQDHGKNLQPCSGSH